MGVNSGSASGVIGGTLGRSTSGTNLIQAQGNVTTSVTGGGSLGGGGTIGGMGGATGGNTGSGTAGGISSGNYNQQRSSNYLSDSRGSGVSSLSRA